MLLQDFYHINYQLSNTIGHKRFCLSFKSQHPIFEAHFPQRPIVPGVCTIEVIRQLICQMSKAELTIIEISNVKFLDIMVPDKDKFYLFDIALTVDDYGNYIAKVNVTSEDDVQCYTKLSMKLSTNSL